MNGVLFNVKRLLAITTRCDASRSFHNEAVIAASLFGGGSPKSQVAVFRDTVFWIGKHGFIVQFHEADERLHDPT